MRSRISRAFVAAMAAGATITTLGLAASPAGAAVAGHHKTLTYSVHGHTVRQVVFAPSAPETGTDANCSNPGFVSETGTVHAYDCAKTGYEATGRDFRFISALATIPDHSPTGADAAQYVGLDASASNNDFSRAGFFPCTPSNCGFTAWVAYVDVQESGTSHFVTAPLTGANPGDGVTLSVYLVPAGNSVHVTVQTAKGTVINNTYDVSAPIYTRAQAFGDWTVPALNAEPAPAPPPTVKTRDFQFFQGRITTVSGARGTFKGPWTLTAVDGTSNGSLPPTGTLISQPSYLWNDGNSYNGLGNDAFGVWRFPF